MRLLLVCLLMCLAGAAPQPRVRPDILIYSGTTGWRHDSIPAAIHAVEAIARTRNLGTIATEDPAIFSNASLKRFSVIVLLSSTTDPKDPKSEWFVGERREALREFVARGGGIVAIHGAADSHYRWPWYGRLIGARFAGHPPGTPAGTIHTRAANQPIVAGLPRVVRRRDEWYYFDDYDPTSTLLVTLDPSSIGDPDANPNPIAWTREVDGGRVFYTAMGHTTESYSDPYFVRHITNGLDWVLQGAASKPAIQPR